MTTSQGLDVPEPVDFSQLPDTMNVASLLLDRKDDQRTGLIFEDQTWTWADYVHQSWKRAEWLTSLRQDGPFHIGVLLENVPDFCFLLGAVALNQGVIVGLNPTRRGAELVRDIQLADCQMIITEDKFLADLEGLDLPVPSERIFSVDSPEYETAISGFGKHPLPTSVDVDGTDLMMLIFTSGTSGDPKAVRVTHRKIAGPGIGLRSMGRIQTSDVAYISMPMFHSACIMAGWSSALAAGATIFLRRRFSASNFLPDVRKHDVTFFHYVGKPLSYVLATPEQPDDHENSLRIAIGNEAADLDIGRFAQRFGCTVADSYGSTEGGVYLSRTDDTPPTSLGSPGEGVEILDPDTGLPVPPGRFDDRGRLLNAEEATGEIVNLAGAGAFDGYYKNDKADNERMRDGIYWSGDLAYRDAEGFVYFAGRSMEWLRVDGENFAAAPVERILARYAGFELAVIFAVPAADVGDQVMTAVTVPHGRSFDPDEFAGFLADQADLGTKWTPRFVRIAKQMPVTETNKVVKRVLAQQGWNTDDEVWWCEDQRGATVYRLMTDADRTQLNREFERHGRGHLLPPSIQ